MTQDTYNLYWIDEFSGYIRKTAKAPTTNSTLYTSGSNYGMDAIAADGAGHLVWSQNANAVKKTLIANASGPGQVAVGGDYVYWIDGNGVHRCAK